MENVENRRMIKLFNCWENQQSGKRGAVSFVSSGYMKRVTIFNEECVGVELQQKMIRYNKPIQIGFVILELAKTKVYNFHYDFMQKVYPDPCKLRLAYTDTDSLLYHIYTEDLYRDLYDYVHNPKSEIEMFDTSNYPIDNQFGYQQVNKGYLGAMKDECASKLMSVFIGLRAKCYTFTIAGDEQPTTKAKGVKKHVAKGLLLEEYEACLLDREKIIVKEQNVFRSRLHEIYTENLKKCALNGNDDKRFIRNDNVNTYAWGHVKIVDEEAAKLNDEEIRRLEYDFIHNVQSWEN